MSVLVIQLDDRALSLARGGHVLATAPSVVFDGTAGSPIGANAWRELRLRPRSISTRHLGALLIQGRAPISDRTPTRAQALVEAELKTLLAKNPLTDNERAWVVIPAQADLSGLTALLGITRRLGLHVDGFMDAAAVTAATLASTQNTIVLELGLHHAAATAVDCGGSQARRRRTVLSERGGLIELYQLWLDLISTTMVKRTRFDPLHDAATEQHLFGAIPSLALEVAATGHTTAAVTKGAERFEVALTRDQFARAAEPVYRAILVLLHQLRPAGAPVAIVAPRMVAQLPGLREQLEQFICCELVSVPDGFAAAATSLLDLPQPVVGEDSVRLLRRLPLHPQKTLGDGVKCEPLGERWAGGPAPSHVLLDGRAFSLSAESLVVGRFPETSNVPSTTTPAAAAPDSRYITLPDGLAGVSRRHCTFVHDGEELVLLDHSSFGTFVNGERVQERVRVHAGDRVKLGEPGVELALIAVGEVAAAAPKS